MGTLAGWQARVEAIAVRFDPAEPDAVLAAQQEPARLGLLERTVEQGVQCGRPRRDRSGAAQSGS